MERSVKLFIAITNTAVGIMWACSGYAAVAFVIGMAAGLAWAAVFRERKHET